MGRKELRGFMIESNLFEGCQQIGEDLSTLRYGVSVTDPCIGWDETESILLKAAYLLQNAERKEENYEKTCSCHPRRGL